MTAVVHPTVTRLAVRSVFGRRRGILLFVLPLVLVALSVLVRALAGADSDVGTEGILIGLGLVVVVPLVSLIATTGLLAPEIDDGSVVYLLAKPLSRHTIVLSKLVVAAGCVVVFAALPMLLAGLMLGTDLRLSVGFAVGALVEGTTYCALFALLSVLTRHAVAVGLIYLLVWEALLGDLLDGVRWFSITQWGRAITEAAGDGFGIAEQLGPGYAVVATVVVAVGCTWLAGYRLRSFNLTGDE